MAVRQPLYYNSSNQIQAMSDAMVESIVKQTVYQYSLSPSVTLSIVGSGGSLDSMVDTRLQAGAQSTSVSAFPSESTTAEPSVVSVTYDKITETRPTITPTTDTGKLFPVYYNASNQVQTMNLTDMKDTFLHPAIDFLTGSITSGADANVTAGLRGGTYFVNTSSGGTMGPIFLNTQADTSAYTSGGIGETLDQPTTMFSYYIATASGVNTSYTLPLSLNASDNLQTFQESTFESLLQEYIRHTAVSSSDGYSISYNINGSGQNRGTGMPDTRLNGTGNYQTRFVNTDDYRAQEFPNGTATTINTYYLKINKS